MDCIEEDKRFISKLQKYTKSYIENSDVEFTYQQFPFQYFPFHVRNTINGAWKFIITRIMLNAFSSVWFIDTDIIPNSYSHKMIAHQGCTRPCKLLRVNHVDALNCPIYSRTNPSIRYRGTTRFLHTQVSHGIRSGFLLK